jgi:hypothetical protein
MAIAAGAGAILALALLFARRPKTRGPRAEPVASVRIAKGAVSATSERERRSLASGDTVHVGETVETEAGASLTLVTTAGRAELVVRERATVIFTSAAEATVTAGAIEATVPADLLLALVTPHGRVIARETTLSLEVGARDTSVAVRSGEALLESARGYPQRLAAGERMSMSAPAQAQR